MRLFLAIIFTISLNNAFAAPQMMICSSSCDSREMIQLSENTWQKVTQIFTPLVSSEAEERKRIAKALQSIELELIERFVDKLGQEGDHERIREKFSNRDETFNTRKAIILFLDHGFIQQHLLRNSQKRSIWIGNSESAVSLQSRSTSEIYVIDPTSTAYGEEPLVALYKNWKNEKSIKRIPAELQKLLKESATADSEEDEF